jgi:hypothetical protein
MRRVSDAAKKFKAQYIDPDDQTFDEDGFSERVQHNSFRRKSSKKI